MQYGGINAKIKAMKSRLLKASDYEELARCQQVPEVGLKLKEFSVYNEPLKSLNEADLTLTRLRIEPKLMLSFMDDFSRIYKFIGDFSLKKYSAAFVLEREIHILKLLLCMVYDERDITYSLPELNILLDKKLNIDVQKLIDSKDVTDFIENLRGTPFYTILATTYEHSQNLFDMEMKLDVHYYINLWKLQNKHLTGDNLKAMERINGTEIDLKNLLWIYRFKKYYKIGEPQIYSYLIPVNYRLTKDQMAKLIQTATEEDLLAEMRNTPYGEELLATPDPEGNFYRIMTELFKKSEINNPNSLVATTHYLFAKGLEIENITSLLEGVRYGLSPEKIMTHVILG